MRTKRILASSGLLGLLGALALVPPASAAGTKAVCVLQGTAKTNPPIPVVGGKGGYTFQELTFVCTGVEKLTDPFVVEFDVRSEGVYKNLLCGTGKATSTRNVLQGQTVLLGDPKTNYAALAPLLKFTVELMCGGSGLLYWHDPRVHKLTTGKPTSVGEPLDPKPHNDKDYGLGGYVQAIPDPTKAPAICTKAFQIAAILMIDTEPTPV